MRLIDADASADKIMRGVETHADEIGMGGTAIAIAFARAMRDETDFPTVDAVLVKYGKLIEGRYPNDFKCSECGQVFRDDIMCIYDIEDKGHQKFPPEYCPECGAKWSGCEFIDELEQKGGA